MHKQQTTQLRFPTCCVYFVFLITTVRLCDLRIRASAAFRAAVAMLATLSCALAFSAQGPTGLHPPAVRPGTAGTLRTANVELNEALCTVLGVSDIEYLQAKNLGMSEKLAKAKEQLVAAKHAQEEARMQMQKLRYEKQERTSVLLQSSRKYYDRFREKISKVHMAHGVDRS